MIIELLEEQSVEDLTDDQAYRFRHSISAVADSYLRDAIRFIETRIDHYQQGLIDAKDVMDYITNVSYNCYAKDARIVRADSL